MMRSAFVAVWPILGVRLGVRVRKDDDATDTMVWRERGKKEKNVNILRFEVRKNEKNN